MRIMYKKILVPLDGSALAAQALPYAQLLASMAQAELILFRAMPGAEKPVAWSLSLQFERFYDKVQEEMLEEATSKLQLLEDDLKRHHIPTTAIVGTGDAASQIVDYAANHDVDLIVMSTHGRTGLARWAYGSVASKVLGAATCPVLLVRSRL